MSVLFSIWILALLGLYLALGACFALLFVTLGVGRVDPLAAQGTIGFRLLLIPGTAALWPILLRRWLRGSPPPVERNAHRVRRGAQG